MNHQTSESPFEKSASRAALYMRVSTGRQAEHDLSIPDQRTVEWEHQFMGDTQRTMTRVTGVMTCVRRDGGVWDA